MRLLRFNITLLLMVVAWMASPAQIVGKSAESLDTDSIQRAFADQHYYFGLYKDNYFIFGPPLGGPIRRNNTNVKFQISIAQKVTKNTLPWGTYLYIFYTQKVFWNILEDSMPMTDINFNPGVGLAKPLFAKGRFIGKMLLMLEHESNGRDAEESRSWNKVTLAGSILVDRNIAVNGKFWIPIIDGMHNKDILRYGGIYQVGAQVMSTSNKFNMSLTLVQRTSHLFNYNTILELAYRFSTKSNEFLFLQYYNGYGEGLLNYKRFVSQVRVGFVIKPNLFSDF